MSSSKLNSLSSFSSLSFFFSSHPFYSSPFQVSGSGSIPIPDRTDGFQFDPKDLSVTPGGSIYGTTPGGSPGFLSFLSLRKHSRMITMKAKFTNVFYNRNEN